MGRARSLLSLAMVVGLLFGVLPGKVLALDSPVTVSLVSDGSPTLRGTQVHFTITVAPDPGPLGQVALYRADNGTYITLPGPIGAGGITVLTWTPTGTFDFPLNACYASDNGIVTCSPTIIQSVYAYATTTKLEIVPAAIYGEEPTTMRVTVSPPPGVPVNVMVATQPFGGARFFAAIDPTTGIGEVTVTASALRNQLGPGRYQFTAYTPRTLPTDPSQSTPVTFDLVPNPPPFLVDDAPFTRSSIVHVAFGALQGSVATEYRLSNDPAVLNGMLVNGAAVAEAGPWTLASGPDGPRSIYGQFRDSTGLWSSVRQLDLVLSTTPPSSIYLDMDPQGGPGYGIWLQPGSDWHTRSSTPNDPMIGQALAPFTPSPAGFSVADGRWVVQLYDHHGPIVPGTYAIPASINEFNCLDVCASVAAGLGNDCIGGGTFTVHAITLTPAADLETLDADFRLVCFGASVMSGSIRYGSARAIVAVDQDVDELVYTSAIVGTPAPSQTVTLTNIGTAPATLRPAALSGDAPGDYHIVGDTCSGATLAVGQSCVVSIRFIPTVRGLRQAVLTIADDTPRGSRMVKLLADATQPTSMSIAAPVVPSFGPADATIVVTVLPPPTGAPILLIDGVQAYGPTEQILAGPPRHTWTYTVRLSPGTHVATASYPGGDFFTPSVATPLSIDVGIGATLTLSTATDDGVAVGESTAIVATLGLGAAVTGGTLQIRDGVSNALLESTLVSGTSATLTHAITAGLGTHPYKAEFIPAGVGVRSATATYDLVVVAGPRPETIMASSTLVTSSFYITSEFSSPDSGVTFQCRYGDSTFWFPCASPYVSYRDSGTTQFLVRAIRPDGLADRTPAARTWIVDITPPSGTILVAGGAAYTTSTEVSIATPATDVGSWVAQVALSNDGTNWTVRPYGASQSWTLPTTDGLRQVYVRWQDAAGSWSPVLSDSIVLDTTPPTVGVPRAGLVVGTALLFGRATVRVTWSGADATSSIATYELAHRIDGGPWTTDSTGLTSPMLAFPLGVGHAYQFRARATDRAGNGGVWSGASTIGLTAINESSTRIAYRGTWRTVRSTAYLAAGARSSVSAGATASITSTARSIGWIARRGPSGGKASVYVNGVRVATVDLYASTFQNQRIVWAGAWASSVARRVTIRVVGTGVRRLVDLDAFLAVN